MQAGEVLVEILRGDRVESVHTGHAVICSGDGEIVEAWGTPEQIIYPRSSCKMLQALPLVESGAAAAFGLSEAELALSCASHLGAPIHTRAVTAWLERIGHRDTDLACGPERPRDQTVLEETIRTDAPVCRVHNNCSGKHTGFLTLARHLSAGPGYEKPDHPVQRAALAAFEETTGETSPGYAIDGCSAPNFATTLHGLARAMAGFASASDQDVRGRAQQTLFRAITRFPELVAGEGGADTELMRAMDGKVAIKTGAEGVYIMIWPEKKLGAALKIADGATRASECAIAALLVKLGALPADHPAIQRRMNTPILNRSDDVVGAVRPGPVLAG